MRSGRRLVEPMRFFLAETVVIGVLVGSIACGPGVAPPATDEAGSSTAGVDTSATEPAGTESAPETDVVFLAPFVTTPYPVIEIMLELAEVDPTDLVYDIGCGDGRIVIMAAQEHGARGVGIDIDPEMIERSKEAAEEAEVSDKVEFRLGDATKMDLSEATVVTMYLVPKSNAILRPQFDEQLRTGTYVVSHNYLIPGWEEKQIGYREWTGADGELHSIWAYRK